ncbi:protein of unknown function [Taphrina deformans PYCC 5710]|uniref:SNF2 family helicase n=1 Tax=Taphrina deformans (strain PYCC 5710 / ATCC 11124 / CBS 356.35 / IMI 108563 / JCM 9778 / NBRC 8474) TaxID=1097556 RepID=R4XE50_TAPDE|nr:protein of unknown function [Taphrina deformans PYCC 5710]|eukprot:CCG83942.1 protein of unknown function [Taphrina deformans PYCC 5710]
MPTRQSKKRKADAVEDDVIDLSSAKTDAEARQHSSSGSTKDGQPDATGQSNEESAQRPQKHASRGTNLTNPTTIDLDALPDRRPVIEIGSDEEEEEFVPDEEYSLHEYIGSFHTKVVGIQYYRGQVTTHESVFLRREPNNAYDRNAIQVLNVNSAQVGHLPARISLGLAPWLDNRVCLVEAAVKAKKQVYSIPITIDVFAHGSVASQIPTALARAGIQLQQVDQSRRVTDGPTQTAGNVIDLEALRAGSTTVSTRQATALLDQLSVKTKDLQAMRQARQPGRLRTNLLNYQLQGLHWMVSKENPSLPTGKDLVQMWKCAKSSSGYVNVASNFTTDSEPVMGRGGLLADDMGLGKTLQVLALIVSQQQDVPDLKLIDDHTSRAVKDKYSNATLVLCPASLMTNWATQSSEHVSRDNPIDLEIYHGKSRSAKKVLESKELIISTYGTLKSEYKAMLADKKSPKSGLFSVRWKRVILDEAHQIRNPKSQVSLAVAALKSSRHWALTGTPIVNSYNDLGSIIRFVGWSGGLESPEIFNAKLTRKLLSPGPDVQKEAVKLIQILMQDLSLRRRKDMEYNGRKLIDLPEFKEYHHKLKFATTEEADIYGKLAKQAQGILRIESKQSQVLEILLRMRQACCAKALISEERLLALDKLDSMDSVEFTDENKALLWEFLALAVESQETCPICLEYLSEHGRDPVVTHCKHVFCKVCISASIASKESCPLCRADLRQTQILELPSKPVESKEEALDDEGVGEPGSSTKITELIRLLRAINSQDATNKTVVFSQWTGLLDLVQAQLGKEDMVVCRVDGSMSLRARDQAIARLQDRSGEGATVLLASLAVASVGLNLTAANSVILLDPWWNAAISDQAVDRVYRLGQTREVSVYKMVIEDSIEEKVLEIQDRKRKMTATIGAGQSRAQQVEARRADLETLLGP